MARKPSGKPAGRPEKEINWQIFEQLCAIQCTQLEIASVLNLNDETVSIRVKKQYGEDYPLVYKRFSAGGKSSLRRFQFAQAKTNASMAIWLGKIWLGQSDKDEVKELAHDVIKQAIRELQTERGVQAISGSSVEAQPSVLDKGRSRKQDQIHSELGTERAVERSSSMQDSSESSSAGDNNVFLPPFP